MKFVVFALCAISCAYGLATDEKATILRNDYQNSPEGYDFAYETDNGISAHAAGLIKTLNKDEVAHTVQGSVSYIAPNGQKIETSYVADEFGYKPTGEHLPTTPAPMPVPEYIKKALEWIATHPYKEPTSKN